MDFNRIILYISLLNEDINKLMYQKFKEIGIQDIKPNYAPIIAAIYNHGGKIQIGDLTNRLKRSKSTITSMVNKLEILGYVKREQCSEDKRVIYLVSTDKTEQFKVKFDIAIEEIVGTKFRRFSEDDKKCFYNLIEQTFGDADKQFSLDKTP